MSFQNTIKNSSDELITVALLLEDMTDVKDISRIFKKIGVLPHFYQNLKEFWHGVLEKIPTFCVVDVRMLSDGELVLKDHPYVVTEQLPLGLFYSEVNAPLLYSTFELFHLGYIRREAPLGGQIKAILSRLNKINRFEIEQNDLGIYGQKLEKQIEVAHRSLEKAKEKASYDQLLKKFAAKLDENVKEDYFVKIVENIFEETNEIESYSCLELDKTGKKLLSPILIGPKYQKMSPLWLGQTCRNGIEFFAQSMASQVALDVFGGEFITLNIKGRGTNPEMIFSLKVVDTSFLDLFDWQHFENILSGAYAKSLLQKQINFLAPEGKILGPWELMNRLDECFHRPTILDESEGPILINLNFSRMISLLEEETSRRFFWKDFCQEFLSGLTGQVGEHFQASFMGVHHLGLFVHEDNSSEFFDKAQAYTKRFSYWRFFNDAEIIIGRDIYPEVKMVPLSPMAYLGFMNGTHQLLEEEKELIPAKNKSDMDSIFKTIKEKVPLEGQAFL